MRNTTKIFFFILTICISFIISVLFWKNISLGYNNPGNVIGFYSDKNLSHYDNLIHFIFFTGFPILIYFLSLKRLYYKEVNITNILISNQTDLYTKNNILKNICIIFFLIITINYISIDLISNTVDYFHEGITLSAALNYKITGLYWEGAYLSNSLFSDILSAIIPWKIFDIVSIGSYRAFHFFLKYITEIFLILFIYKLSFVYDYKKNTQNIFFIIMTIISLKLNRDLTEIFYPFRYRDIPIFILLFLSVDFIKFDNKKLLNPFLLGFFSSISVLWSVDRGIYYFIGLLVLIFLILIKKRFQSFALIILGVFSSFLIIFIYFGQIEFQSFIYNTVNVLKDFDLFGGSKYPTIFESTSKHAGRGTSNLMIIILNGFLISFLFINQKLKLTNNSRLILLFFFIISCVLYRSSLGVTDGYHMKQSIFFNKIFLISNLIFIFFQSNFLDSNKKLKFLTYIILTLIISKNLIVTNFSNILTFKERNLLLIKKDDDTFLDQKYIDLRNVMLKNYDLKCVQLFSHDIIVPYLLKKKYCTKFNFLYVVSSENVQDEMIDQLKDKMPNIVILNQNYDFIGLKPVEERFKKISSYIDQNYLIDRQIKGWEIHRKK